jgi:hypothetical protein
VFIQSSRDSAFIFIARGVHRKHTASLKTIILDLTFTLTTSTAAADSRGVVGLCRSIGRAAAR